jgi:predicted Zn-dependent protease
MRVAEMLRLQSRSATGAAHRRGAVSPQRLVGACGLLALAFACSSDLQSAERRAKAKKTILLSTAYDDERVGDDVAKEIEAEMGLYESPELTAYVGEIGRRLVGYAPMRPFQYKFLILDQMEPNAFSLPGGHIYVSRGLIALANSEDELAGVLGHEIIHAAERHVAAQQEMSRRGNPFVIPYLRMAKLAAYSRDAERSADRGGQELAAKAGYDPKALSTFLEHLGDSERLDIGYSRLTSYFSTHPGTTERVAATAADAVPMKWTRDPMRTDGREEHLRQIDGIVLGTDPAEGIFRESEFLHPDMNFRILFPHGWELVNSPQAVGAATQGGNVRILLTARSATRQEQADPDSPLTARTQVPQPISAREAAEQFIEDTSDEFEVRAVRSQAIQVGPIDAHRIDVEGHMAGTAIAGQVTFVPHNGLMFRITGIALASQWPQYVGRARTVARTFRALTEEEQQSIEVLQLRVVRAQEGEDIASLSERTRNAWSIGRTAVLNSTFVYTRFDEDALVKIARPSRYIPAADTDVDANVDTGEEEPR